MHIYRPETDFDLPDIAIVTYLFDLYYEHFHPNHCFLLPKKCAMKYMSRKSDAAVLHAMFAVSCRFVDMDPQRCEQVGIQRFHRDPVYWADLFQKHRAMLFNTPLVKGLLLVGMSMCAGNDVVRARELADEAYQLCCWNNLDKRFSRTTEMSNMSNKKILQAFSPQQLMYRESLIRTVWEVWKFRVQVALFSKDPSMVPPFNGDMCLPVSDTLYENELEGWNYKRYFWSDMDAELLDETPAQAALNPVPRPREASSMYNGACMTIVCTNLLALVFKYRASLAPGVGQTLADRLETLHRKLPAVQSRTARSKGYHMAHLALASATLLLHADRAAPFLAVVHTSSAAQTGRDDVYEVRPASYVGAVVAEGWDRRNDEACRSYLYCQWAANSVYELLGNPDAAEVSENGNAKTEANVRFWTHMSPLTAFLLHQALPWFAGEVVLQRAIGSTTGSVAGLGSDDDEGSPSATSVSASASPDLTDLRFGSSRNSSITSQSSSSTASSPLTSKPDFSSATSTSSSTDHNIIDVDLESSSEYEFESVPPPSEGAGLGHSVIGFYTSSSAHGNSSKTTTTTQKLTRFVNAQTALAQIWERSAYFLGKGRWLLGELGISIEA